MIQTLADLQSYVSNLINDPTNTRYGLPLINSQLDLCQHRWNSEVKIVRYTDGFTLYANMYRYNTNLFTFTPIQILRVTMKGVPLNIRSKSYFDKYSASDWTATDGTPTDFVMDLNSFGLLSDNQQYQYPTFILHPTPQANDATLYSNGNGVANQLPLQIEYLCPHNVMVNPTDTPFSIGTIPNKLIIPYLAGLGLDAAASILEPDPTAETVKKAQIFRAQANGYLSLVVQMYQGLEEDTPGRMAGGRSWQMGNSGTTQSW